MIITLVLVGLAVVVPVAIQTSGEDYVWVGLANDNDSRWTLFQNWDPNDNYPHTANDTARIDDPTNFNGLVTADAPHLTIGELFVGDGHTIELDDHVSVAKTVSEGVLEFDGIVVVSDAQEGQWHMDAKSISINSTQRTTVSFTAGDGDGCIFTDGLEAGCTSG
ncbi:MAG: hypothetical protein C4547_13640 [Phycisphaerales bacterium]|nr:MAG: hypothetical protein C4547_13640 [Phycisphaerales bacterium]